MLDIVGQQFSRLSILSYYGKDRHHHYYLCTCSCGGVKKVKRGCLITGHTRSCGCLAYESRVQNIRKSNGRGIRHGHTRGRSITTEYNAYQNMKTRCTNRKNRAWKNYGGRGIRVLYKNFEEFLADLGLKPSPELTVDRINNDGNYEPGNCRWATYKEQNQNKRRKL